MNSHACFAVTYQLLYGPDDGGDLEVWEVVELRRAAC